MSSNGEHTRGENKAQPWASIAAFYQDLTSYGWGHEMLALTQHIISSGAAERLFAYTSHATLKISIYASRVGSTEELTIDFDQKKKSFCFRYYARPIIYEQPEFYREYTPEIVAEKFDQFLRWIRW
ncbi:hypothetical protein [Hymenobacter sp. B1770]|uniref:hypothetical protein n=1 Tax=Hymenobacter sp. B1770 TaxID=1718788 RepID=UPI003CF329E5